MADGEHQKPPPGPRRSGPADDSREVEGTARSADAGERLLSLYDDALPRVYGYLLTRCGRVTLAEDLCAQTFFAAVRAVRDHDPVPLSVAWLIGVARHKLVDHWRTQAREERSVRLAAEGQPHDDDPWDVQLDALRARDTLDKLAAPHRAALTLRYLDDLPVPEVASHLDRSVHATESLLARARGAFRRAYTLEEPGDE